MTFTLKVGVTMAEKTKFAVLTVRFRTEPQGIVAVIQFGNRELERPVPDSMAVTGINVVVSGEALLDAELITQKE